MAKQKTKEVGFGVKATEVKPGRWEFEIGPFKWAYDTNYRVNLRLINEGVETGAVYVADIKQAGMFAEGWYSHYLTTKQLDTENVATSGVSPQ